MQLLFLSGSKTLLLERNSAISPSNMSCFFSLIEEAALGEIERFFSLEHAAVVSLWIEEAALERS